MAVDDDAFAAEGRDAVSRYHAWIERERVDATGLAWVILPDETGCDASPVFDAPLGWRAHGHPGFMLLVQQVRRRGFSFRRTRGPVFQDGFALQSWERVFRQASDPVWNSILYSAAATLLIVSAGTLVPGEPQRGHRPTGSSCSLRKALFICEATLT